MSDKIKKSEDLTNISTEDLFFSDSDLTSGSINSIVNDSLHKADDGELFLEYCESESFVFDDQKLKSASFDVSRLPLFDCAYFRVIRLRYGQLSAVSLCN